MPTESYKAECDCEVIHADVVENARKNALEQTVAFDLADLYKIFGDSTRLRLLWALDHNEMCVCDLAVLLNMTKSAVSHQLKVLRQAKLVKNRKDGKVVFYSLADDHIKQILEKGLEHITE